MRELVNTTLGQYQITEIIQHGGMATVYKAAQPSLERTVAIKVLLNNGNPQFVARFKREARAIGQLHHENILPIYDYGEQDGLLYLVMQYIESGVTLANLLGAPLDPVRALRLIRLVLNGLGYAHERGVVHRDIKPSNILMPRPDWPVLADFGIAKIAGDEQNLTVPGYILGTTAYMAPEQVDERPVDGRADLYALGVVLYEMLTGRVPFVASAPVAVIKMHLEDPPPPPRSINPSLPAIVEPVLLRALEKDPARRYQRAADMAEDIDQLVAVVDQLVTQSRLARLYQSGSEAFRQGHWALAIERLRQLVALDPGYEDGLELLEAAREEQRQAESTAQRRMETIQQRRHDLRPAADPAPPISTPSSAAPLPPPAGPANGVELPGSAGKGEAAAGPGRTRRWPWPRLLPLALAALAIIAALIVLLRGATLGAGTLGPPAGESPALPAPQGALVFEDDFSQSVGRSGLEDALADPELARGVQDGAYRIVPAGPSETRLATLPRRAYGDFSLQLDLSDVSPSLEGGAAQGVAFRVRDSGHYYALLLDPRGGRYSVIRQSGDGRIELVPPTASPLVRRSGETNRLRVDAAGDSFSVYLNGAPLTTFSDAGYPTGMLGLLAVSQGGSAPQLQFDNLAVWSADAPPRASGLPAVREDPTGTMVLIPGGEFILGGDAAAGEEAHLVAIPSFYIDRAEVTNEAYARCVGAGRCTPPAPPDSQTRPGYVSDPQFAGYPVVNVTWPQAREFCSYAGKRLPTEADWEKAASWDAARREKRVWPWGDQFDPARLNSAEAGPGDTSAAEQLPAALNGLVGMAGNVLEWTSSADGPYPYDPADGREGAEGTAERILRGGAWTQGQELARTFARQRAAPDTARNDIGFRCAATP